MRDFPQRCIDTNDDGCRYEGQYWLHWPPLPAAAAPPISYTNKPNFLNGFVMALSLSRRGTKNHSSMRWTLPGEKYVAAITILQINIHFKFNKNHRSLRNYLYFFLAACFFSVGISLPQRKEEEERIGVGGIDEKKIDARGLCCSFLYSDPLFKRSIPCPPEPDKNDPKSWSHSLFTASATFGSQ